MPLDPRLLLALQQRSAAQSGFPPPPSSTYGGGSTGVGTTGVFTSPVYASTASSPAPSNPYGLTARFTPEQASAVADGGGGAVTTQEGGIRGLIGGIFSNPIVKNLMVPLTVLDTGRRAVVSGLKEALDAASFMPGGQFRVESDGASLSDWWNQTKDPNFGYGDIVDTDNKWVDRAAGFVGDVALDPLTYVTFGGNQMARYGGRVGREALAADAATAAFQRGIAPEVAEGMVSAAGRLGPAGLNPAAREALGMEQAGLRFMGQRLPGTEGLANAVGRATSGTRARIGDAAPVFRRQGMMVPEVFQSQQRLATGAGPMSAVNAAANISAFRTARGLGTEARSAIAQEAERVVRDARKFDNAPVVRAIELQLDGVADGGFRQFLDDTFNTTNEALAAAGAAPLERRSGYVPHVWTKEGKAWLQGSTPLAAEFRRVMGTAADKADTQFGREITAGTKIGDTVLREGSIAEINAVAAREGVKALHDEIPVLVEYTLHQTDQAVRAAGVERSLLDSGVARQLDDLSVLRPAVDKKSTQEFQQGANKLLRSKPVRAKLQAQVNDLAKVDSATASRLAKVFKAQPDMTAQDALALVDQEIARTDAVIASKGTGTAKAVKTARAQRDAAQAKLDAIRATVADNFGDPQFKRESGLLTDESVAARELINAQQGVDVANLDARELAAARAANTAVGAERQGLVDQVATFKDAEKRLNKQTRRLGAKGADAKIMVEDLEDLRPLVDDPEVGPTISALLDDYARNAEILGDSAADVMTKASKKPQAAEIYMQTLADGWSKITQDSGIAVPDEVATAWKNIERLKEPSEWSGFLRAVDAYTTVFKAWATSTPGFHVRNAYSAATMNLVAGVTSDNMIKGIRYWHRYAKNPKTWLETIPEAERAAAKAAMEAVFSSGAGQFDEFAITGGPRLANTVINRKSKNLGRRIEGAVRLGMALDTTLAGGTLNSAIARITRFHFNYTEVSKFDQSMKRLVPFWTFTSRNLPMQVEMMWTRPRIYEMYGHVQRNLNEDREGDIVPLSWANGGAFALNRSSDDSRGGAYWNPDMPWMRVNEQIARYSDPITALADANPLFRVPVETLLADKRLYNGQPFTGKYLEDTNLQKLDIFGLLGALGIEETTPSGDKVISDRWDYALNNLNPLLAQSERLVPSQEYYQDRHLQSTMNWAGLPVKLLNDSQYNGEVQRRYWEQQRYMDQLRQLAQAG